MPPKIDYISRPEFLKEQTLNQDYRHDNNKNLQSVYTNVDSQKTDIALLQQEDSHIVKELQAIKWNMTDHMRNEEKAMWWIIDQISNLRKDIKTEYSWKTEVSFLAEKIKTINTVFKVIWTAIWLTIVAALLKLILI